MAIDISKPLVKSQRFVYEPLGIEATLDWRPPTTSEMRNYTTEAGRSYAGKESSPDFPFGHGLAILVGIKDGDWADNGNPISSDSQSPDFRPDWKEVLAKHDIGRMFIAGLATIAFNGLIAKKDEVEKEAVPFGKSGGESKQTATPSAEASA